MTSLRIGTVTLIVALAMAACSRSGPEPEPVRSVRTQTVSMGQSGGTKEFAADIRARTESRLSFRVGGKIVQRPAELGQRVKAGQLLAQLDPEDLRRGQEAAQAAVSAAETNAEQLKSEYQRFKVLRDQGFISAWDLDRRGAALASAQAQLDQAKAQAQVQRNQAAYSALTANASGVVTAMEVEVGAVVAAGTPVLRLALDGPRDVVFAVPEDTMVSMKHLLGKQDALNVRIWGKDGTWPATLRELAASADPSTRTFQAKADVGNAELQLGQTATVMVDTPRTDGVVTLPLSALTRQQDKTSVWVVDKTTMTVRPAPVVVGGAQGNDVLVTNGLAAGQEVVTAGAHVLTPGQKVKFFQPPPTAGGATPAAIAGASGTPVPAATAGGSTAASAAAAR